MLAGGVEVEPGVAYLSASLVGLVVDVGSAVFLGEGLSVLFEFVWVGFGPSFACFGSSFFVDFVVLFCIGAGAWFAGYASAVFGVGVFVVVV